MQQLIMKETTYSNKIGDTTFIVKNTYKGTIPIFDAFEEIIVRAFRARCFGTKSNESSERHSFEGQ